MKNKPDLKKFLYSALDSLQRQAQRINSLFKLPDTQYAAAYSTDINVWIYIMTSIPILLGADAGLNHSEGTSTPQNIQRHAVLQARRGNYDQAIKMLSDLYEHNRKDKPILYDYITVLVWSGNYDQALQLAEQLEPELTPQYVSVEVAKAAREKRDFKTSIKWYQLALKKTHKENKQAVLGLGLAYADNGEYTKAFNALKYLDSKNVNDVDTLNAKAYIASSKGDNVLALELYDKVLATDVKNKEAIKGKVASLRKLGLNQLALSIMVQHPLYFTSNEINQVKADIAATYIRWSRLQEGKKRQDKHTDIDLALRKLTENLENFPPDSNEFKRTQYDLVVAFVIKRKYQEAVALYENLTSPPSQLPTYLLESVAVAYNEIKEPEKAIAISRSLLEKNPSLYEAKVIQIYSNLDLLRYDEAISAADELVESEPYWIVSPESEVKRDNPRKVEALILSALSRSQADDLDGAEAILEQALLLAPNNTDIRHELASVYARRGWLDRSIEEYDQVLAIEPDLVSARIGYSDVLLDRGLYKKSDEQIKFLMENYEHDRRLSELHKRWNNYKRSEFVVDGFYGESTGGGPQGQAEYLLDAYLYSRPLAYSYRIFTHSFNASSKFEEGYGERFRIGAGLEYRGEDWISSFEFSGSLDGDSDFGGTVNALYRINDYWNLESSLQVDTNEIPLQAVLANVRANLLTIGTSASVSEKWSVDGSLNTMDFDDGNLRKSLLSTGNWLVINKPRYKGTVIAGAYGSHNSKQDVPYFNPEYDASFTVGLNNLLTSYRRFDHIFEQLFSLSAGVYKQKNFDTDYIGEVRYHHIHSLGQSFDLNYGVRFNRAVYDGEVEYNITGLVSLSAKF